MATARRRWLRSRWSAAWRGAPDRSTTIPPEVLERLADRLFFAE